MSNSVTNILTINGTEEQVAKVRDYIKGSNGEPISFQSIFPMPKSLKGKRMVKVKGVNPPSGLEKPLTIPDWMDWRFKWWGTHEDADPIQDDVVDAPNRIIFNTPSTTPLNAMIILSVLFPEVTFNVIFCDQNENFFCGEYTLFGGEAENMVWYDALATEHIDISTDQKMEYYFRTHEYARDEWKKDEDGKWVHIYSETNS